MTATDQQVLREAIGLTPMERAELIDALLKKLRSEGRRGNRGRLEV